MTGLLALTASTDYTVSNPPSGATHEFYNLIAHDTAGAGANVDLFLSNDAASAAGERIDRVQLGANETKSFQPIGVPAGKYLIAKSSASGTTVHGEYIYRDGADA